MKFGSIGRHAAAGLATVLVAFGTLSSPSAAVAAPAPVSASAVAVTPAAKPSTLRALLSPAVQAKAEQNLLALKRLGKAYGYDNKAPSVAGVTKYIKKAAAATEAQAVARAKAKKVTLPKLGVVIIQPGKTFTTSCGGPPIPADEQNAFYCDTDGAGGSIILPVLTMQALWAGNVFNILTLPANDALVAAVVQHEGGHGLQFRYANKKKLPYPAFPDLELVADCYAGAFATGDKFKKEDTDAERSLFGSIGDDDENVDSHGTGVERQTSFKAGLKDIKNCRTYWPQSPFTGPVPK